MLRLKFKGYRSESDISCNSNRSHKITFTVYLFSDQVYIVQIQDIGLDYMTQAARMGDPGSALYLAKAYDSGLNLGSDRQVNF